MEPNQMPQGLPPRPSFMMGQQTPQPQEEMATPEEIQALKDMLASAQKKLDDLNVSNFTSKAQEEQRRTQILHQVFDKLKTAGVDLNDPGSVSAFLARLKDQNPEVAQYFETAMDELLGEESQPLQGSPDEGLFPEE